MTLKNYASLCGIVSLSSVVLLTGCAATVPVQPEDQGASQLLLIPDKSLPTTPMAVVVAQGGGSVEDVVPEPVPGSVASVLKKIEINPHSLYWREKHAYTYFVGEMLDAEYRPNEKSLRVRDVAGEDAVVCVYDADGALRKTEGIDERSSSVTEVCSKLMLSLDDDMSS